MVGRGQSGWTAESMNTRFLDEAEKVMLSRSSSHPAGNGPCRGNLVPCFPHSCIYPWRFRCIKWPQAQWGRAVGAPRSRKPADMAHREIVGPSSFSQPWGPALLCDVSDWAVCPLHGVVQWKHAESKAGHGLVDRNTLRGSQEPEPVFAQESWFSVC